jgi:hypothetical protein
MYQSQQRSTDLCTDFYIHPTQYSFCGWILIEIQFVDLLGSATILNSVPCVAPLMNYFRTSHRLAEHLYPVPLRAEFITINLSCSCRIRYRVFPVKMPAFRLTVNWFVNPFCTYTL